MQKMTTFSINCLLSIVPLILQSLFSSFPICEKVLSHLVLSMSCTVNLIYSDFISSIAVSCLKDMPFVTLASFPNLFLTFFFTSFLMLFPEPSRRRYKLSKLVTITPPTLILAIFSHLRVSN